MVFFRPQHLSSRETIERALAGGTIHVPDPKELRRPKRLRSESGSRPFDARHRTPSGRGRMVTGFDFPALWLLSAGIATICLAHGRAVADDDWVRVMSDDKRASVMFPSEPDKVEKVARSSPAGRIVTERAIYERAGVLLTIAQTKLPRAAIALVSPKKLLQRAAGGVLENFLGKAVSQTPMEIGGRPGMVLRYRVPDYDDAAHPGYEGIAIALLVDDKLYVVNGILTSEDPKAKAKQTRLLTSIKVHD